MTNIRITVSQSIRVYKKKSLKLSFQNYGFGFFFFKITPIKILLTKNYEETVKTLCYVETNSRPNDRLGDIKDVDSQIN